MKRVAVCLSGAWLLAVALHASVAQAHGDAHERIAVLSQRVNADPDNLSLRLRRADLYLSHRQWADAERDLAHVRERAPEANTWRLPLARMRLDQGRPADVLALLAPVLNAEAPSGASDAVGLRLLAQAHSALGQYAQAATVQAARLAILDAPEVGDYLEWADDAVRAGEASTGLQALDAGLQRLGLLVVLQRRAVEIEQAQRHWPEALARLATLLHSSPRKEGLLLWRAQIERQAGLPAQALASLAEATAAVDLLPVVPRTASAMTILRSQIDAERRLLTPK
jgi:predicted Zn-dependent protease